MKAIYFHNWGRKGDLHVSRSFVKRIAQHVKVPCYYYHNEAAGILADVPAEHRHRSQEDAQPSAYTTTEAKDGTWWINTWYGAGTHQFASKEHEDLITFDTLYRLFAHATSRFDVPLHSLGEPLNFLPSIGWKAFPATTLASERMNALPPRTGKRVLFDTVDCLSGQAHNFPLVPVLRNVAVRRPGVTFFYTHAHPLARQALPPNAVWTRDVHGVTKGVDLNENAFISTHCQLIIGRMASTYTFTLLREHMVQRPTRFLTFSRLAYPMFIGPQFATSIKLTCQVTQSHTTSRDEAIELVLKEVDAL